MKALHFERRWHLRRKVGEISNFQHWWTQTNAEHNWEANLGFIVERLVKLSEIDLRQIKHGKVRTMALLLSRDIQLSYDEAESSHLALIKLPYRVWDFNCCQNCFLSTGYQRPERCRNVHYGYTRDTIRLVGFLKRACQKLVKNNFARLLKEKKLKVRFPITENVHNWAMSNGRMMIKKLRFYSQEFA